MTERRAARCPNALAALTSGTVAYLRVSSVSQDAASQRDAIERYMTARGESVSEWFSEKMSAKSLVRPELERLLAHVRMGTVRRVVCFKLDRLCRSGVADTFKVVSLLKAARCELVCVADNLVIRAQEDDLATDAILFGLSIGAKLERLAGEERRAAARARLRAEARPWGRPMRMDAATIERAAAMRESGRSLRAIAVALKIPRATIARTLERVSQKSPSVLGRPLRAGDEAQPGAEDK